MAQGDFCLTDKDVMISLVTMRGDTGFSLLALNRRIHPNK